MSEPTRDPRAGRTLPSGRTASARSYVVPRTRLGRAVAAGVWAYRRWRLVLIALHAAVVAIFAIIALLAAAALPGSLAMTILVMSVVFALWFALRLPATIRFTRRRPRERSVEGYPMPRRGGEDARRRP